MLKTDYPKFWPDKLREVSLDCYNILSQECDSLPESLNSDILKGIQVSTNEIPEKQILRETSALGDVAQNFAGGQVNNPNPKESSTFGYSTDPHSASVFGRGLD